MHTRSNHLIIPSVHTFSQKPFFCSIMYVHLTHSCAIITIDKIHTIHVSNLSHVNGSSPGTSTEVKVTRVSLSSIRVDFRKRTNIIGSHISIISCLHSSLISRTNSLENLIGLSNCSILLGLVFGVSSRVEEDEGILLLGNSLEISSSDSSLESSDTISVESTSTVDGGSGDGSVSRCDGGDSGKDGSSGGDLGKSGATVHVQGSAGALNTGGSKSSNGGNKKSSNGELHDD
mmetsp:Transcript_15540/g.29310  ORF Transcript_15540/g.29310 Transcript_15540/m.29310 type:complete len:232 (+) Transcript_15540:135-830(+)